MALPLIHHVVPPGGPERKAVENGRAVAPSRTQRMGGPGFARGGMVLPESGRRTIVRVDDLMRNDEFGSRSSLGGVAARLAAQCGLVGGVQLIARARCVRVGARDAEVELAQFVDHRRHELGAPVA
jgi:hypothetical protein